jgi:hypothetical protein
LKGPNTNEEEVFVPNLKFNEAERIFSNYHEFVEALHQAAALKFGAIARVIKLNDWLLLPMPSSTKTDEATSKFELHLIIEDY